MTAESTEMHDEDLVRRSLEARDAFGELVSRYYCTVYSVAYARIGQREAAEEIAQEVFLRAYLNLKSLRQTDRFPAWVCCIARNLAENWRIRGQVRSRLVPTVPLDAVEAAIPDARAVPAREKLEAEEESAALRAALARLPAEQREVVVLHFLDGLGKSEIAKRFGMHPSSIGRQLDKALEWLRRELGGAPAQAVRAAAPSGSAAGRAAAVALAAAALPHAARAALETAAAADAVALATGAPLSAAAQTTPLLHKLALYATHGGKTMLIAKGLAAGAVIAAVVAGTHHYTIARKDGRAAAQARAAATTRLGSGGTAGMLPPQSTGADTDTPQPPGPADSADTATQQDAAARPATTGAATDIARQHQARPGGAAQRPARPAGKAVPAVAAPAADPVDDGVRQMVLRTRSDMRAMATAIESYYVDNNCYPSSDPARNIRKMLPGQPNVSSFASTCLTTPIAYITYVPEDPFAGEGQIFAYHMALQPVPGSTPKSAGWILLSPGPDGRFDLDPSVYRAGLNPGVYAPQPELVAAAYDPTNGTVSAGDIWRINQ